MNREQECGQGGLERLLKAQQRAGKHENQPGHQHVPGDDRGMKPKWTLTTKGAIEKECYEDQRTIIKTGHDLGWNEEITPVAHGAELLQDQRIVPNKSVMQRRGKKSRSHDNRQPGAK